MVADMTTEVILPPDWLNMKKVAIPAEIAIIAIFMKRDSNCTFKQIFQLGLVCLAKVTYRSSTVLRTVAFESLCLNANEKYQIRPAGCT